MRAFGIVEHRPIVRGAIEYIHVDQRQVPVEVDTGGGRQRTRAGGDEKIQVYNTGSGEVSEWFKEHAWKACIR